MIKKNMMLTKLAFHPHRHLNLMKIYQIEIPFHAIVELLILHQRRELYAHHYEEPAMRKKEIKQNEYMMDKNRSNILIHIALHDLNEY